ncbi:MAG TPA: hypothetical protein VIL86_01460 [Tepidisphaeraceae bacterium]|jgi:hypothetical protein
MRYFTLACIALVGAAGLLSAAEKEKDKEVPWTVPALLKRIAPLKHDNAGRFPMICIDIFRMTPEDKSWEEGKPLPPETIRALAKRGLTQWIPPREKYIPYAQALQKEGARVIMMEGYAFNGWGSEIDGKDDPELLHILPKDYTPDPRPAQQSRFPCPLELAGWKHKADELRTTFKKYKDAGVTVDAVWLDWEIEPEGGTAQWHEAQACSRCRKTFPAGVLDDHDKYDSFITRLHNEIFSAYAVAPILENYPACSVTSWHEVISTPDHPTPTWSGRGTVPPTGIGMFTAANPVVYGNTAWYEIHWKKEWNWPLDVPHMDRVYTQVMLASISMHEENARRCAPEKQSIPWVDRFCADDKDPKIPILSRPRYREILRHCWLRGADGMQIFNPNWFKDDPAREVIVAEEVEDAVLVYDEMLEYRRFLDSGETMNTASPKATDDGPIWSGLRLGDEAVIRVFTQADKPVKATITPFKNGPAIELTCPPEGRTYLLKRSGEKIEVRP